MPLVTVVITLGVVGLLLWLVNRFIPMQGQIKGILNANYNVTLATSGKECLKSVAEKKPDCIVMDVMMDDLSDGLEAAKTLKESNQTKDIPVILLTSVNKSYDYRSQADASYFPHDVWMDKPVNADRLLKELQRLAG